MKTMFKTCAFIFLASAFIPYSMATTVQFQTVAGDFEVNLFDQDTPQTVDNFLQYIAEGHYENVIFHRSADNFVIQGGGFQIIEGQVSSITTFPSVENEPEFSNVRGTIAMAKLGNQPNSATSQWFFNLKNNSASLDASNGGFSVFGQVMDNGMEVVDALASWPTFAFTSPFGELPLRDYTNDDYTANVSPTEEHYALVYNIVVLDAAEDTAASLSPTKNTVSGGDSPSDSGGGGGSTSIMFLIALFGLYIGRRYKR
ncbi:Peptidyl-prolyl cis-trans isomerase (rotamase)-cyclophilin family [Alteromonadaceae bacterium Bs31]|nr:Peptidyl-prolyl cis-trans isomerase (rotamase)-cyclophilin family [Alteromonadaceae bacterium Bs31]